MRVHDIKKRTPEGVLFLHLLILARTREILHPPVLSDLVEEPPRSSTFVENLHLLNRRKFLLQLRRKEKVEDLLLWHGEIPLRQCLHHGRHLLSAPLGGMGLMVQASVAQIRVEAFAATGVKRNVFTLGSSFMVRTMSESFHSAM